MRWLSAAYADGEGLCVPGHPEPRAADLLLRRRGVVVRAGRATAWLGWDDYLVPIPADDAGDEPADGWSVARLVEYRTTGVGVEVRGARLLAATEAVREATVALWDYVGSVIDTRRVIRFAGQGYDAHVTDEERDTLAALVAALGHRPELRDGMGDPARAARLADDLAARPVRRLDPPPAIRMATQATLTAMRLLGYDHRIGGRPVPGERLAPLDEVVRRTVDLVYLTQGITLDAGRVADLARRHYLDVEPWPFEALAVPATPARPG